jgi:hypothetical protein
MAIRFIDIGKGGSDPADEIVIRVFTDADASSGNGTEVMRIRQGWVLIGKTTSDGVNLLQVAGGIDVEGDYHADGTAGATGTSGGGDGVKQGIVTSLGNHSTRTNNPHSVTAAQAGAVPVDAVANQPASTAAVLADLVTDFNALLSKLKAANVMVED